MTERYRFTVAPFPEYNINLWRQGDEGPDPLQRCCSMTGFVIVNIFTTPDGIHMPPDLPQPRQRPGSTVCRLTPGAGVNSEHLSRRQMMRLPIDPRIPGSDWPLARINRSGIWLRQRGTPGINSPVVNHSYPHL
jgi:hypothetical protein